MIPFRDPARPPPEQVKALDGVCGEELDHRQLLYKVLEPILFGGQRAAS